MKAYFNPSIVQHWDFQLTFNEELLFAQLVHQRVLVNRFQESRTELAMYFDGRTDYLLSQLSMLQR